MKEKNVSGKELTWYIISGVLAAFGLSLIITNIVGTYTTGPLADNNIYQAEVVLKKAIKIPFDFMGWGFFFIIVALIITVWVLLHFAKKYDLGRDREIKRQQRLGK